LELLGFSHRRGVLHLLLVLPDGSRSLVPAAWTDLEAARAAVGGGVLASLEDLVAARRVLDAVLERVVLAARDDRSRRIDHAAASGCGGEPGVDRGVVGADGRATSGGGDAVAGRVDGAGRHGEREVDGSGE
jgi:hypothetical protein